MKNWLLLCFLFSIPHLFASPSDPSLAHSVNVVLGEWQEVAVDLQSPGPKPLQLKRAYPFIGLEGVPTGWQFSFPNVGIAQTKKPQEALPKNFQAVFDRSNKLTRIIQNDPANTAPLHDMQFAYTAEKGKQLCTVTSETGDTVTYEWLLPSAKEGEGGPLLQKILFQDGSYIRYEYALQAKDRRHLLTKRIDPMGHSVETVRYQPGDNQFGSVSLKISDPHDWRIGRILGLKQRSVDGAQEHLLATFVYRSGETEVIDASQHTQLYKYDTQGRITAIEAFLDSKQPYRMEKFYWDKESHLIGQALCNSQGEALSSHTFEYDKSGHLIHEAIWGNLSGKGSETFRIGNTGKPLDLHTEKHQIDYTYEDGTDLVIKKVENNGLSLSYTYDPQTSQETAKVLAENGIEKLAQYSLYNSRGFLIEQAFVDLSSNKGERYTIKYDLIEKDLHAGLPQKITRYAGDGSIQEQTLLTYTPQGLICTKEKQSPSGRILESECYTYDRRGRLLLKSNAQGDNEEIAYDLSGQVVQKTIKKQGIDKHKELYTYDTNGLCLSSSLQKEGVEVQTVYQYDAVGNKINEAKSDNSLSYRYDSLGRCLSKIGLSAPYIAQHYTYREDNAPIAIKDGNGRETKIRYNIRRQPIEISYPDGTSERFFYSLDGNMTEAHLRSGWKKTLSIDYLGRELSTLMHIPGQTPQKTENHYNAFHLIERLDENGIKTEFSYDLAGKESLRRTYTPAGTLCVESAYSTEGSLCEQKEWIEGDPASLVTTRITNDFQGYFFELFDWQGVKIRHQEMSRQQDSASTAELMLDQDSQGHTVIKKVETQPNGLRTLITEDLRGFVQSIQEFSAQGTLVSHKEFHYDPTGQKSNEISHLINQHGFDTGIARKTAWNYGPCGRLGAIHTSSEDKEVRSTHYVYDEKGQLISTLQPNGQRVIRSYDSAGHLERLYSEDHSIDYRYLYDQAGRVIQSSDLNTGVTVSKSYDALGHLVEELIHPNRPLKWTYDARGRRTQTQLPDGSSILYTYDALALRSISRIDSEQNTRYTHTYQYNWQGEIESFQPIGNSSLVHSTRTNTEWQLSYPFWKQLVSLNVWGKPFAISEEDASGNLQQQLFEHDDRGQLVSENNSAVTTYTYNSWGERLSKNESPLEYNAWGELVTCEGKEFVYDQNGNLTQQLQKLQELSYSYDALNRLTSVWNATTRTHYTYDAYDRRLSKAFQIWNAAEQRWKTQDIEYYLYEGHNEIAALDANYNIKQLRVLGEGLGGDIGAAVALELEGRVYAPIHDYRGSIVALMDPDSQTLVERYRYSAFGETEVLDASDQVCVQSLVHNPWRFSSKRFDAETGWYYFGRRYYDASIGRWTTQDPLAILEGGSPYSYVNNSPLQQIDLYGLFSLGGAWNSIKNGFLGFWNWKEGAINSMQTSLSLEYELKSDVHFILEEAFGYLFLSFSGYYNQPMETGSYGNGQVQDKLRITFINGIANVRYDLGNTLKVLFKSHGNTPINYVFFPTQGWGRDLLRSLSIKLGFTSPTAYALAETWRKLIIEMGGTEGGGLIIHYAHSIGGANTLAAAQMLTPEERKMLRIVTLGTATIIPDLGFDKLMHYISVRDGVSILADPFGFLKAWWSQNAQVTFIGSWMGLPFIDHALSFTTYINILEGLGEEFLKEFGLLSE